MNMRPPIQKTPNGNCYNHFRPLLPIPDCPKSPDIFNVSSLIDASYESRFSTNQQYPLLSPCIEHYRSTDLDVQPDVFTNYEIVVGDSLWNNGQLHGLIDYPESMPFCNGEIMSNDNHVEIVNWTDLTEEEMYVDSMEPNRNELLANSKLADQQPKAPQSFSATVVPRPIIQYQLPLPYTEVSASANLASASQSSKSRMRWKPELHDAFVDAVNNLGGYESATPKGILMRMKVQGLSIYQVKSHLQKYRDAMIKIKSSEGKSEVSPTDLKTCITLTEALRMQMKVQKQLHEQLEIQRKLQLRIEKQGKYLLQMLESQTNAEKNSLKLGQSKAGRPSYLDNKLEFLYLDPLPSRVGTSSSSQTRGEIPCGSKGKQKVLEGSSGAYPHPEADEPAPPLMKRLRIE